MPEKDIEDYKKSLYRKLGRLLLLQNSQVIFAHISLISQAVAKTRMAIGTLSDYALQAETKDNLLKTDSAMPEQNLISINFIQIQTLITHLGRLITLYKNLNEYNNSKLSNQGEGQEPLSSIETEIESVLESIQNLQLR